MDFQGRARSPGSLTHDRVPAAGCFRAVPNHLVLLHAVEDTVDVPVSQPCQIIWFSYQILRHAVEVGFHSRARSPGSLTGGALWVPAFEFQSRPESSGTLTACKRAWFQGRVRSPGSLTDERGDEFLQQFQSHAEPPGSLT